MKTTRTKINMGQVEEKNNDNKIKRNFNTFEYVLSILQISIDILGYQPRKFNFNICLITIYMHNSRNGEGRIEINKRFTRQIHMLICKKELLHEEHLPIYFSSF